jgi:hypothetical protein
MQLTFNDIIKASTKKGMLQMDNQPPKKTITERNDMTIMELYSARKNNANPILEYSTLNPETSSDSASGKSKGALLVSAKILIKNIKNKGNRGIIKNTNDWNLTICIKFKEPTHNKIVIKINPKDTSYDIICAAERSAPK